MPESDRTQSRTPHLIAWSALCCILACVTPTAIANDDDPGLPTTRPERVGMSSERLTRIAPVMQSYIDKQLVAGTVTLIARRGQVVHFEAQGFMDAENRVPMRRDAIFRIASMTKPIASVALMQLWEQGKFQLTDPVSTFLPEFAGQMVSANADVTDTGDALTPVVEDSTIQQMLTHTAGLANRYLGNGDGYVEAMEGPRDRNLEAYVKQLAALPLHYQPGADWQYSTATTVVGRLVEIMSGQNLDEYLREHIFDPLDMQDTHFFLDDTKGGRLAAQYEPGDDEKIVLADPGSEQSHLITGPKTLFSGSGGLVSTARDYVRFQQTMLNGGRLDDVHVLAPTTVSLMLENHTGDLPIWVRGPGYGFGLGYGIVRDRGAAATPLRRGTGVWGGAYCTISWFDPTEEIVGVLMTQVRPYAHLNIRKDFQVLTYQAIDESFADSRQ